MSEIRAFLALRIPPEVQAHLSQLQQKLRPLLPPMSWVRPENIHVTLKFFGNILPTVVDALHEALRGIGPQAMPFSLNVQGIGVFPYLRTPRVFWVGLMPGAEDRLRKLHDQVQLHLEPLGFPIEE